MEEDIKILEEIDPKDLLNCWSGGMEEYNALQNLLKRYKKMEEENKNLNTQNMMMSQRHFNDSQKIKTLDQAMTYMLQDLEVEKKGWTIEEMKRSYLVRAKANGIFIKKEE